MSSVLGVLTLPEAKVEPWLDKIRNVSYLWVGLGGIIFHYGTDYDARGVLLYLNMGFLVAVNIDFLDEASVYTIVVLVIWGGSGVGQSIQEVGHHNFPPFLINPIFTKLVQVSLGVVVMADSVSVNLEDIYSR